uniref:Retrovirus-related Pol polyprotein from transposon TNT 1-94 n=1 Tax=Tanacetum cinerariifolium TaxID=118510 RepID=A0A6L2M106_TANCI|nr:retrovirus-related Pol polyprotein from transposon TNT 1-94 [Tanacetum cinerariifolium]
MLTYKIMYFTGPDDERRTEMPRNHCVFHGPLRKKLYCTALGFIYLKIVLRNSEESPYKSFAAALAVLICEASQSRQHGIPTASEEFPLAEQFPTANEDKLPLLSQSDATAEELCAAAEVIEFGDSYEAPKDDVATGSTTEGIGKKKGRTVALTTEDMKKRKNYVKARTTLLLALPDEHQLRFSKLQAIVSHLEFMDIEIEQDDLNQKFLTSLPPEWLMHTSVWRNKSDLDTMSLDDLYNHLKVYKSEVQKKSESNSQNMAFISSAKNSSRNEEVNTDCIPTASTYVSPTSANIGAASIRKKISIQGTDVAGFDKSKVECFNCHKMGHFAKECRAPRSQDRGRRDNYRQGSKVEEQALKALMVIDGVGWDWIFMENEEENHALVADEEAPTEFALMTKTSAECEVEARLVKFKNQEVKYCEKIRGLDFKVESRANRFESLTNGIELLKKEKEGLDNKLTGFQTASKDLNSLLESQRSSKNKDLSWTGLPEFADDTVTNYSRPPPAIESTSDDLQNRNPSVTETRASPSNIVSKLFIKFVEATDSPTENKADKVETVRMTTVKYAELYRKTLKKSNNHMDDKGYWDSGCSRHMTGHISYLSDYEPFDGGYVSFGQGGCKITRKGTIKTECIVLGRDFKLIDDTNVLFRTPRQHNMYSIDLNNIFSHKDLTCLVAKASADECMLWHRRVGHLNFKTMNKLVRHNLVRSLPTKCFENDHNCTTCLKEKQHKASCKTKLVNSVTKRLHTLHMDLFGPTSVVTSGILRNSIIEIENLKELRVKIMRCDNGEAARTMLVDAKLPVTFWAKAVNTACYVQNRVLVNKCQNKTPYELFNGRTPATGFLKPFRCHVMIINTLEHLGKFDAKGDKGYFIGYSMSSKAFRVFNKTTRRVEENLHVHFLENKLIEKGASPNWLFDIDSLTNSMNYVPVVVAGINSTNFSGTKEAAGQDTSTSNAQDAYNADAPESSGNSNPTATSINPLADHIETLAVETLILTVSSPVLTACLNDSLEPSSNVWSLVDCPKGVRPIRTKWVLKNKKDERGIVIRNKARLVAQGHTQEEGIDYDEVFAPVARIEAIRLFLAYASFMGFTVYQMDVKSAFLYGTIDKEVYVMQPLGFQDPEFPARVYKVEKAMYGLHQDPRDWYGTLSKYLLTNGFQRVLQKEDGIFLSQDKYVGDILKKFGYSDVRSANTPMDKENPWGKDTTRKDVDLHLYRSMIGTLMYLTASRPDIMFAICTCARHQVTPNEYHLHAIVTMVVLLKIANQLLEGQFLGRRLISWQCKKQTIVATLTTKAEYVATASGCGQVLRIQN